MRVELLIYIYGAICLSMIGFNCACILLFRRSDRRMEHTSRMFDQKVNAQLQHLSCGGNVQEEHLRYLNRKLSRLGNLMAFDNSLQRMYQDDPAAVQQYLYEIQPVLLYLSVVYLKKETMQSAYFAYFLSRYKVSHHMPVDAFVETLKEYLKKDSLYCRQNAMKTLYSFACEKDILEAIKILEHSAGFFHGKILTDGLLTFAGDHDRLIELLWQSLDSFKVETQVAILNYIRFRTGTFCEKMMQILQDQTVSPELHYAAIRYFGKYTYPPALPLLKAFAADHDQLHWNYAAVSASALANYPGAETLEVLKKALTSSNWYVRYNAAQSIEHLGATYEDLIDIISGNDRYAREMITYRFDCRQIKEEKGERMPV